MSYYPKKRILKVDKSLQISACTDGHIDNVHIIVTEKVLNSVRIYSNMFIQSYAIFPLV